MRRLRRGESPDGEGRGLKLTSEQMGELLSDDDLWQSPPVSPGPGGGGATTTPATVGAPTHSSASLNPHKALFATSQTTISSEPPQPSTDPAVARLRGLVRQPPSPGQRPPLSPPLPPPDRPRRLSVGSRQSRAVGGGGGGVKPDRKWRIDTAFRDLEGALPLPFCAERRSRVEVVEHAVSHLRELQRSVNAAAERNSELHDLVETLTPPPDQRRGRHGRNRASSVSTALVDAFRTLPPLNQSDLGLASFTIVVALVASSETGAPLRKLTGIAVSLGRVVTGRLLGLCVPLLLCFLVWQRARKSILLAEYAGRVVDACRILAGQQPARRPTREGQSTPAAGPVPRQRQQSQETQQSRRSSLSAPASSHPASSHPLTPNLSHAEPPQEHQPRRAGGMPRQVVLQAPRPSQTLSPHCRLGGLAAPAGWRKSHSAEDLEALSRVDGAAALHVQELLGARARAISQPAPPQHLRPGSTQR
eukprot:Hpha_TRINITY_DN4844_c0_g1::TRINITY_DN4844_c0_g1_i1::g.20337::m.20337